MRIMASPVLLLIPVLASAQAGARMEDEGIPRVSATATRTARVTPDRVTLYAVFEGGGETAAEAAQRAERKIQGLNDLMKQLGTRAELVSSVPYGVMPAPNFGGYPGQTQSTPFVGRYIVRVQPARVDQTMSVTSALMTGGATSVMPMFEAAAADSARRAKFVEALAQARADAEALATGLGMRLGALVEVTSNPGPAQGNFGGAFVNLGRPFDFSGPVQMPEATVVSTVTVRYRLTPR